MGEKFKNLKEENKILVMLAFFSISIGLWGNFRQLWLQDNGMNVTQISNILSFATFMCAIGILFIATKIKLNQLKKFMIFAMALKALNLIACLFLNHSQEQTLLQISIIIDVVIERLIIISIYPFIVTIKKENNLYSKRKLVEYLFKDVGILIGGFLIGRMILGIAINYNILLIISILFLWLSCATMINIKEPKVIEKKKESKNFFYFLRESKITKVYLATYFIGSVAMTTGLGLKMLMLTNLLGFSDGGATNYLLIIGLLADLLGIICLKFLQPKNDYITMTIKLGIRMVNYLLAFFANNYYISLLAITWSILISTAYENVSDAPYINRVPNEYQMLFTDARYLIGVIAESIGMLLAGQMYYLGVNYLLGLSAFFMIFQISLTYYGIYLRHKNEKKEGFQFNIPTHKAIYLEDPLRKI